jgi:hypothetical protein
MDKYEFITQLLDRDQLKADHRERIVKLAAKEIEKDRILGIDFDNRLKALEEKISRPEDKKIKNPKYIDTRQLSIFLKDYNKDPILMCTSHEVDVEILANILKWTELQQFDFVSFIKLAQERYRQLKSKHRIIYEYIYPRINTYLFGPSKADNSGWSDDHIMITWQSPALLEWASRHPGIPPNPCFSVAKNYRNTGFEFEPIRTYRRDVRNMRELVIYFKNTIRINHENNLKSILQAINEKYEFDKILDIELYESRIAINVELFTDVDKLIQCYKDIIAMIVKLPLQRETSKHRVQIDFAITDNTIHFSILHINSIFSKTANNLLDRLGDRHDKLVKKVVGLCDLYLNADFGNGHYYRINLFDKYLPYATEIPPIEGVQHEMVFAL